MNWDSAYSLEFDTKIPDIVLFSILVVWKIYLKIF